MTKEEQRAKVIRTLQKVDRIATAMREMGIKEDIETVLERLATTAEQKPRKFKQGLNFL